MPVDTSFARSLIGIMQQARAVARQRELDRQAEEDRRLEREGMKLRLSQMRFQDRVNQWKLRRGAAQEQFEAVEGTPERDVTPEMLEGGVLPVRTSQVPGAPTARNPMAPVEFPGFEDLGIRGFTRRPQTREERMADILKQRAAEARIDAATRAARLQRFEGVRNGQRQFFNYDPETGAVFDLRGLVEVPDVQPPPRASETPTATSQTTNARVTRQQQVKDLRAALVAALAQDAGPDVLGRLQKQAEGLKLTWDDELRTGRLNAAAQRIRAARGSQLLETVPRDPFTGKPTEDPSAARRRRLASGDQILRGDEPEAADSATRAEVEQLAQMWGVSYAEAKRRVQANGKTVIE